MKIEYVCSICGKKNVKLWRPYGDSAPLICAECAEKRQTPREYRETIWTKVGEDHFSGKFTGEKFPLPKWKVNQEGKIPTDIGPVLEEMKIPMTDQLIVDISDVSKAYSSGSTTMIPACLTDEEDNFWCYTVVPEEACKCWDELPTR